MMDKEPDYDNMHLVRMAIVERGDRLVILMPSTATDAEVETFVSNYENIGWPTDRVLVLKGPQAFAVLKDEGQGGEEQPQGDQADAAEGGTEEGSDAEADRGQDQEQQVESDGHTSVDTPAGQCLHGIPWKGMSWSHFAMEHKTDHP